MEFSINKAGVRGLVARCERCRAECVVKDEQDDIVMTGTAHGNTFGAGTGRLEFVGTTYRDLCRCLMLYQQLPAIEWVSL